MELEDYGIHLVLKKGMSIEKQSLNPALLKHGSFSQSKGYFELPSGMYSLGPQLGRSGSYGSTYQAIHSSTNRVYAIKVIRIKSSDNVKNTIKESIINILLEKVSENKPDGPYVPRFYEIAYDPLRELLLLRVERLHGIVHDLYYASTKEQNDVIVPQTLGDIAHILNFYHKTLQFNHRDLKSDNIGYVLSSEGKHVVKLIDFGFACITWKGVQISGASYFPVTDPCYIPSRDIMLFLFEIMSFMNHLFSLKLFMFLKSLLVFPLDGRVCKLLEGCRIGKHKLAPKDWRGDVHESIYDFLNNPDVMNPHTIPKETHRRMLEFLGQEMTKQTTPLKLADAAVTAKIRTCLPEQILNPKTRRCVSRAGKLGQKILRDLEKRTPSPTQIRSLKSSKTRKTRKTSKTHKTSKPHKKCKADEEYYSVTRRCRKSCKPNQIRNPTTQRCVNRTGAIGRRL